MNKLLILHLHPAKTWVWIQNYAGDHGWLLLHSPWGCILRGLAAQSGDYGIQCELFFSFKSRKYVSQHSSNDNASLINASLIIWIWIWICITKTLNLWLFHIVMCRINHWFKPFQADIVLDFAFSPLWCTSSNLCDNCDDENLSVEFLKQHDSSLCLHGRNPKQVLL